MFSWKNPEKKQRRKIQRKRIKVVTKTKTNETGVESAADGQVIR